MKMRLTSPAFLDGEHIPSRYTCNGENESPPLVWVGAPKTTKSFALLCDDPDAPLGKWHHWAVYDIKPSVEALLAAVSPTDGGYKQAINDFRHPGYGGPCPPSGHGPHRYYFRMLALDLAELGVLPQATCKEVEAEARKHMLAEAHLCGTYGR